MALKVVIGARGRCNKKPCVSVDPNHKRLLINKSALEIMTKKYNSKFDYVLLLRDPELPNYFWIKPCSKEPDGARRLGYPSPGTRLISCSLLLKELNWPDKESKLYPLCWDNENNAAKIEITKSV